MTLQMEVDANESYTGSRQYLYTHHKKFLRALHEASWNFIESAIRDIREFFKFETQLHAEVRTCLLETYIF